MKKIIKSNNQNNQNNQILPLFSELYMRYSNIEKV